MENEDHIVSKNSGGQQSIISLQSQSDGVVSLGELRDSTWWVHEVITEDTARQAWGTNDSETTSSSHYQDNLQPTLHTLGPAALELLPIQVEGMNYRKQTKANQKN